MVSGALVALLEMEVAFRGPAMRVRRVGDLVGREETKLWASSEAVGARVDVEAGATAREELVLVEAAVEMAEIQEAEVGAEVVEEGPEGLVERAMGVRGGMESYLVEVVMVVEVVARRLPPSQKSRHLLILNHLHRCTS